MPLFSAPPRIVSVPLSSSPLNFQTGLATAEPAEMALSINAAATRSSARAALLLCFCMTGLLFCSMDGRTATADGNPLQNKLFPQDQPQVKILPKPSGYPGGPQAVPHVGVTFHPCARKRGPIQARETYSPLR